MASQTDFTFQYGAKNIENSQHLRPTHITKSQFTPKERVNSYCVFYFQKIPFKKTRDYFHS